MIPKTEIPQRSDKVTEKILNDEIILYNTINHNIHSLNKTAGILWNLCDGKASIKEMINYLLKTCKGEKDIIEKDVLKTLEDMNKNNLITF